MSYGFLTDLNPPVHHRRRNNRNSENGSRKSKLTLTKHKNPNVEFQNKVLTDDDSDVSDSQIFRTAIPAKSNQEENQEARNKILNSQTTHGKASKDSEDLDQTRCSILDQIDDPDIPKEHIEVSETTESRSKSTKKKSSGNLFSSEKTGSDPNSHKNRTNKSEFADTVIGDVSVLETQLSYLDINTNNREEVLTENKSRFADTVIGSCTQSDFPSDSNRLIQESMGDHVENPENPEETVESSILTAVTISSTDSEKKDSMEKDHSNYSEADETQSEAMISEVISIPDSDEEEESSFPESKLPEKGDDSFENCSSIYPGTAGSALSRKINDFFDNVPSINTPERFVTHSMIKNARRSIGEREEEEEEAGSEENRFVRNDEEDDYYEDDERVQCVVDESVESIEHPEEDQNEKFRTQVIRRSKIVQQEVEENCSRLQSLEISEKSSRTPRSRIQDENQNNEKLESEQQIVNSENTVSRSISKSSVVSKSAGKFSTKINISATIKINIQIHGDTSESSEANTSSSSEDPSDSEEAYKRTKDQGTPKNSGNERSTSHSKVQEENQDKPTPKSVSRKETPKNPPKEAEKISISKRYNLTMTESPQQGTSKAAQEINGGSKKKEESGRKNEESSKRQEKNPEKREKPGPKSRKKLLLPDLQQNQETPGKDNENEAEFTALEADIMRDIYGDSWKTETMPKSLRKSVNTKKSLGEKNFSIFERKLPDDLESTRLSSSRPTTPQQTPKKSSLITSPHFNKNLENQGRKEETPGPAGKLKNLRKVKTPATPRYMEICDPDTSSGSDYSSDSDESYKCTDDKDSDSDEDFEIKPKKPATKRRVREKSPDPVFNISSSEAEDESPKKQEKSREQQIVDDYLSIPRGQHHETTATKGKRKLFTHRHFDSDAEEVPVEPPQRKEVQETKENEDLVQIDPKIFKKPFNKFLMSVQQHDLGLTPQKITIEQTPQKTKTPRSTPKKNGAQQKPASPKTTTKSTSAENIEKARNNFGSFSFLKSLDREVSKNFCHHEALLYREKYKTKKVELAEKLFKLFNEKIFDEKLNVPITWNKKLSNTAGRCINRRKAGERFCAIELSDKVLTSADRLRCTLIHELCHAATWIYNAETGHGATWKGWAAKANQTFPELPKISTCHDYAIEYKYSYVCKLCKAKYQTHSKSKKVEEVRCSICKGEIELFLNKKNKNGEIVHTPVREPTGFAKFVQEKYKEFKRPDLKHAEVMKLLGAEFAQLSVHKKMLY